MINFHIASFQAETEELARKVESLTTENVTLKSEITRLTESSEKLRMENDALMVLFKYSYNISHTIPTHFMSCSY